MMQIPKMPSICSTPKQPRSLDSITLERIQNMKLRELGIEPYEYSTNLTEEQQNILDEALKLIALDKEIPKDLEDKVKEITKSAPKDLEY